MVVPLDGDGATIMHMGALAIVGNRKPENLIHVVFNNGAHDSVGGQPTVGLQIDLPTIAKASGYKDAWRITNRQELDSLTSRITGCNGPVLIEIQVKKGNRKDLGRPTTTPIQNKEAFMQLLNQ